MKMDLLRISPSDDGSAAEAADEAPHFENADRGQDAVHGQTAGDNDLVDAGRLLLDGVQHLDLLFIQL